eukprot:3642061-Amphidinium_carterae.1
MCIFNSGQAHSRGWALVQTHHRPAPKVRVGPLVPIGYFLEDGTIYAPVSVFLFLNGPFV